jgi:hypothetical protein
VKTSRPISPVAAQNITVTNTATAQAMGDVLLSAVSDSMILAMTEAGEVNSGVDSAPAEKGGTEGGAEESGSREPTGETAAESTTDSSTTESSVASEISAPEMTAPTVDTSQVLENNTEVSASHQATIKAAKELYIDNMRFNAELPKIVMEVITIRLSNITFPAGAAVQ